VLVAVAVFLLNSTVGLLTKELSTGLPLSSSAKLILPNVRKVIVIFAHSNFIIPKRCSSTGKILNRPISLQLTFSFGHVTMSHQNPPHQTSARQQTSPLMCSRTPLAEND